MGKIFNKWLSEDYKEEGLFKRLKNIECKKKYSYKQLKTKEKNNWRKLKNINRSATLKEIEGFKFSVEGKKILYEVTKVDKDLDTAELVCTKTDGKT